MKKCLWHTACVENDCEELCPLFCDVDDITNGGLKKIGFKRTKSSLLRILTEILRIILNLIIEKFFYCLVNKRIFLL